ncbi:hypothetical protein [Weissella confusa]|jgi:hypothetical protein|uniref:hypothetical protein n=1 Tax=Weissella confusa TaxID=1583 RepID=UPI0018F1BFE1|nr:hypothetical protein [Weissella confusa]MBJ7690660.1 hypothetical protein [Weissella confusa]MBJ7701106.1 hypothetical protein [Weissella confusa]
MADYDIGSTGVAHLHHSFAPDEEFDIEAERKRILQHNGRLERRTTWVTPGENQVKKDEYESRYQVFKKMQDAGKSASEIASAIGVSKVTPSSLRYRGRYQKENA